MSRGIETKPGADRGGGRFRAPAVALSLLLAACAPSTPEVTTLAPLSLGADAPIVLTAARQKDAIARALRAAGFRLVDAADERAYLLRVTIGVDQDARSCGTLNNVRYQLRVGGESVVVAEAKGWTGACEPNVFDALSQALRRQMVEAATRTGAHQ